MTKKQRIKRIEKIIATKIFPVLFKDTKYENWQEWDDLRETPYRIAKAWVEDFFAGIYNGEEFDSVEKHVVVFDKQHTNENAPLTVIGPISFSSICPHHFLPYFGQAVVGYIPTDKELGASKFKRILDIVSKQPLKQEDLVVEYHKKLVELLGNEDVIVYTSAVHTCMLARGIRDREEITCTKLSGRFEQNESLRMEFLEYLKLMMTNKRSSL